jgi:hypothetical protein
LVVFFLNLPSSSTFRLLNLTPSIVSWPQYILLVVLNGAIFRASLGPSTTSVTLPGPWAV